MKAPISIAVADDHGILRQGLVVLLKRNSTIKVLFDVSNGKELLTRLKKQVPEVILLDLKMPEMRGEIAFDEIKKKYPKIKVIAVTALFDEATIVDCFRRGFNSILPKDYLVGKIIQAIHHVHKHGVYMPPEVSTILAASQAKPHQKEAEPLKETELLIIKLICQHLVSKEIAVKLDLSKKTIDWYRGEIFRKTGTKSVTEIVEYAYRHKIVEL